MSQFDDLVAEYDRILFQDAPADQHETIERVLLSVIANRHRRLGLSPRDSALRMAAALETT